MTGAEFKQIRNDLGLNIKRLAKYLDVSERQVIRWESAEEIRRTVEYALRWYKTHVHAAMGENTQ